jgi:hypothetical protein
VRDVSSAAYTSMWTLLIAISHSKEHKRNTRRMVVPCLKRQTGSLGASLNLALDCLRRSVEISALAFQ